MRRQMKRKEGLVERFVKWFKRFSKRKLFKNKVYSTLLMIMGYVAMQLTKEVTVFIFVLMLALPVFFARENVILD